MPFEVFRRHQKKLLAIFAILAMFGFVLSDSVPRMMNASSQGRDQKVVELYGRTVYQSDISEMYEQRAIANAVIADLYYRLSQGRMPIRNRFGDLKTRDLVDALILQHEADRLGMPVGPELGRDYLKQITQNQMTRELFEDLARPFSNKVSGEQLLAAIGNQVRLEQVRRLFGAPLVTPYDVFCSYRDQSERVSAKVIEIPVDRFISKVGEPTQEDVQKLYDQYKDVLPDPDRETPGFKVPRQIQVDFASIDGTALAKKINETLSEADLKAAYENRKSDFEVQSELPKDLFAGSPELTPPIILPFDAVRGAIATSLAEDKAQSEILDKFTKVKEEDMIPFADKYRAALDDFEEAKKQGSKQAFTPPPAPEIKSAVEKAGLKYETSPLLSADVADRFGQISIAEVGLNHTAGGRKFSDEFFDSKTTLFEPVELSDLLGNRYLARKIQDNPPYVPPLDQVRAEVVHAWKIAKARPLAEKAASDLAAEIKKQGGTIKEPIPDGYRLVTIRPIARKRFDILPGQFMDFGPPVDTMIPEIPEAGASFRDALFSLDKGAVAATPNQAKTSWYVLSLDQRDPATFAALYAPNGDEFRYKSLSRDEASRGLDTQWMNWLRTDAGVKSDWIPPDEAKENKNSQSS